MSLSFKYWLVVPDLPIDSETISLIEALGIEKKHLRIKHVKTIKAVTEALLVYE